MGKNAKVKFQEKKITGQVKTRSKSRGELLGVFYVCKW